MGAGAARWTLAARPLFPGDQALKLNAEPGPLRERYTSAQPFPHIVIDGLFADETLDAILAEFPRPDEIEWAAFDNATEKKLGYKHTSPLGPAICGISSGEMSSPPVLQFLEALTGIEGLIPDPYFGGAGPHQILPGGFLKIHADFNWHPLLKLDRRLNLLVYLNKDWREEYGGHLELWDRDMTRCGQRILPVFNRTVVFSTTDFSFHGHPTPLACPPGMDPQVGLVLLLHERPAGRGALGAARHDLQEDARARVGGRARAAGWRASSRRWSSWRPCWRSTAARSTGRSPAKTSS